MISQSGARIKEMPSQNYKHTKVQERKAVRSKYTQLQLAKEGMWQPAHEEVFLLSI